MVLHSFYFTDVCQATGKGNKIAFRTEIGETLLCTVYLSRQSAYRALICGSP